MEPVSILALANTCLGITTRIGTISKQLWTLKEKFKHVERMILLFETQLAAIKTAIMAFKGNSLGYMPAEHIETPVERPGRLNKYRNDDIVRELSGDESTKVSDLKVAFSRVLKGKKGKKVRFDSVTFFESDFVTDESSEEEGIPNQG